MQIKIQSTDGIIWQGKSEKITVPTSKGEITILPNHVQIISDISNGVIKIYVSDDLLGSEKYTYKDNAIILSSSNGILYVGDNNVSIISDYVSITTDESIQNLKDIKDKLQLELGNINNKIDPDEYMNILTQIEKINADIRLHKFMA